MKFEKIEYFIRWEATPTGFGISTYERVRIGHWPILTLSCVEIQNPVDVDLYEIY